MCAISTLLNNRFLPLHLLSSYSMPVPCVPVMFYAILHAQRKVKGKYTLNLEMSISERPSNQRALSFLSFFFFTLFLSFFPLSLTTWLWTEMKAEKRKTVTDGEYGRPSRSVSLVFPGVRGDVRDEKERGDELQRGLCYQAQS